MTDYVLPGQEAIIEQDPEFPHAPAGWTREEAERIAQAEGLTMSDLHWRVVRALQDYFHRHEDAPSIQIRELHDALDEAFHAEGGLRRLYENFPGGPVAQGCRIGGLKAPAGAVDRSFGSVV